MPAVAVAPSAFAARYRISHGPSCSAMSISVSCGCVLAFDLQDRFSRSHTDDRRFRLKASPQRRERSSAAGPMFPRTSAATPNACRCSGSTSSMRTGSRISGSTPMRPSGTGRVHADEGISILKAVDQAGNRRSGLSSACSQRHEGFAAAPRAANLLRSDSRFRCDRQFLPGWQADELDRHGACCPPRQGLAGRLRQASRTAPVARIPIPALLWAGCRAFRDLPPPARFGTF